MESQRKSRKTESELLDASAPYGRKANGEPYRVSPEQRAKLAANLSRTPNHAGSRTVASASRASTPEVPTVTESEPVAVPEPVKRAPVTSLGDLAGMLERLLQQNQRLVARIEALESKKPAVPASASRSPRDTGTVAEPAKGPKGNAEIAAGLIEWSSKLTSPKADYVRDVAELIAKGETEIPLPSESRHADAFAKFGTNYTAGTLKGLEKHGVKLA